MVPYKGRLSFKQYIRNKPTRWGINLWVLCEAATGYVYRFQVYLEKKDGNVESKLAQRAVRDLMATKHYKNNHLHMHNYYLWGTCGHGMAGQMYCVFSVHHQPSSCKRANIHYEKGKERSRTTMILSPY